MIISIKNKSYYPKQKTCTEKGICGICGYWKNNKCNGYFAKIITEEDLRIIKLKWRQILGDKGYITKNKLLEIAEEYGIRITDRLLNWYHTIGLIEPGIKKRIPGEPGTVSFYRDDTPKIIYVIQELKESGFKIKLEDFKYWLELLNLDENAVKEIKKIYEDFKNHLKYIFQNYGMTPKKRIELLRKCDIRVLNYDMMVTKFDILKRVFAERAYTELDQKFITDLYLKNLNPKDIDVDWTDDMEIIMDVTNNPVDNALDYPEMSINLEIPEIRIIYTDPINKTVMFKQNGVIEVI